MTTSTAKNEVIGLCIAIEAIGDILNHALMEICGKEKHLKDVTVLFHSRIHQQLFLIRLLDFAKETGDFGLTGVKGSCLDVIASACETKTFDTNNSVCALKDATTKLQQWLNTPATLKLWIPTLNIEAELKVTRLYLLYISGNEAKHNISRLTGLTKNIQKMLGDHGHIVPLEQIPLALDDFAEHLTEHFFVYYSTWLAELLNNLRWGLQEYLNPIFKNCYKSAPELGEMAYRYDYPISMDSDISKSWFWRLMNNIRTGPYYEKFSASEYLKKEEI